MTLTTRILLLVMLALAPALAIQGYNEYALRTSRDEAVRADAMATARTVAEDLSQVAETARQALNFVAQDLTVRAMEPAGCTEYLHRAATDNPHLAVLALTRIDGTVVCNSVGSPAGSYAVPDRSYQRRAVAEDTFVMGTYARGNASRKDSLHFAQPLHDANGHTVGVLAAAIDLDWLAKYLRRNLRLSSTSVTVADENQSSWSATRTAMVGSASRSRLSGYAFLLNGARVSVSISGSTDARGSWPTPNLPARPRRPGSPSAATATSPTPTSMRRRVGEWS